MSLLRRRVIAFAGAAVAIETQDVCAGAVVDFLFRQMPDGGGVVPHARYRIVVEDGTAGMRLSRENLLLYAGASKASLAEYLLGDVCHQLAEESRGGLLFHAAGLARQGRGLVLPGGIGAGKTTLAAWLVAKGFNYLSDEMVFVPLGASTMQAFARPLNLKRDARRALQDVFDFAQHKADILSTPTADLISPSLLNPANCLSEPPVRVLIFPRYRPDSGFTCRALSKAQAGLALMQCLVNARNLPGHGFSEITRLVKETRAYAMQYGSFEQVGETVEHLLETEA